MGRDVPRQRTRLSHRTGSGAHRGRRAPPTDRHPPPGRRRMSTFPRPNRAATEMVWVRAPISGARRQVHRELAPLLAWVVGEAERRGYLFDHGPSDVGDDWGYNVRRIAGSSSWSYHSAG